MEKMLRVGKVILALTSCSGGVAVSKTDAVPSKESVEIFNQVITLTDSIKY